MEYQQPLRLARIRISALLWISGLSAAMAGETTIYVNKYFEVREQDQPVKYVHAGEARVASITGSLSTAPRIQRLRLHPGWNLCSVAVDVPVLPRPAEGEITAAFRWNDVGRSWLTLTTNEPVASGTILWLNSSVHTTFTLKGNYVTPTNRPAGPGATFVPSGGLETLTPAVPGNGFSLWRFDEADQSWRPVTSGIPEPGPGVLLSPGDAAFVSSPSSYDWQPPENVLSVRYYHQDHLGSSSAITDAAGMLLEEVAYYPFGTPRNEHRLRQFREPYGYTQKERDQESQLHYFETRYLAGRLSRFTRPDYKYLHLDSLPRQELASLLLTPQKLNLYAYVGNNPLKFIDPLGEDATKPQKEEAPPMSLTVTGAESGPVEIPIDSYTFSSRREIQGGGRDAGVSENSTELYVTRSIDSSSPGLKKQAIKAAEFSEVTLTVRHPRTAHGGLFQVKLKGVTVTGFGPAASPESGKEYFVLSGKYALPPQSSTPQSEPAPKDQVSRLVNPLAPTPQFDADRAAAETAKSFREALTGRNYK